MNNNEVQEYINKFEGETRELIVTISWLGQGVKGTMKPSKIGNYFSCIAATSSAIDCSTNEDLGFINLKWLGCRKGIFGYKYGYKFDINHLYKVKVKRNMNENSYLVLELLEKLGNSSNNKVVATASPKVSEKTKVSTDHVFKSKYCELTYYMQYFAGAFNYNGDNIKFYIDEAQEDEKLRLDKIDEICSNISDYDTKFKKAIVNDLLKTTANWTDDGKPVTEEQFLNNISLSSIEVMSDGSLEVSYETNLFEDHEIHVYVDKSGNITEVTL